MRGGLRDPIAQFQDIDDQPRTSGVQQRRVELGVDLRIATTTFDEIDMAGQESIAAAEDFPNRLVLRQRQAAFRRETARQSLVECPHFESIANLVKAERANSE